MFSFASLSQKINFSRALINLQENQFFSVMFVHKYETCTLGWRPGTQRMPENSTVHVFIIPNRLYGTGDPTQLDHNFTKTRNDDFFILF